jgi:hypothetical protein
MPPPRGLADFVMPALAVPVATKADTTPAVSANLALLQLGNPISPLFSTVLVD